MRIFGAAPCRLLIPFVGDGDEVTVAVARQRRRRARLRAGRRARCSFVALALDRAFVGEVAQHALELRRGSAFLRPKARAISRVPTLPGVLAMKARMSALEGRVEVYLGGLFNSVCLRRNGA